ncbi:MAG TPA: hypothetical protein VEJ42_09520 [Streptosporangiaceae bacterium]|nr:hypothetical protein [Streptosporangiaceae bacterium]
MTRHASSVVLASLAVGELGRRKAAKVSAHVAGCAQCTRVSAQLTDVTAILASTPYPALPDAVSVHIEAALRVEVNKRVAAAPATEVGRRDLPTPARRQPAGQRGWHLPGLSVAATRLVAAAGAVVLVGGGGYLLARDLPSGVGTSSSSSAALPAPAQPMTPGPNVTYGQAGSQRTVHTVVSSTNFVPSELRSQVITAVREAESRGESTVAPSGHASAPTALAPLNGAAASGGTGSALAGCIDTVGPGRAVLLIDEARYGGKPATIIVFAGSTTTQAEAIVVTDACSASSQDVLARAPLGHL